MERIEERPDGPAAPALDPCRRMDPAPGDDDPPGKRTAGCAPARPSVRRLDEAALALMARDPVTRRRVCELLEAGDVVLFIGQDLADETSMLPVTDVRRRLLTRLTATGARIVPSPSREPERERPPVLSRGITW